jgi:hypothetical protein
VWPQQNIKTADFESLAVFLKQVGFAEGDISELKETITNRNQADERGFWAPSDGLDRQSGRQVCGGRYENLDLGGFEYSV